MRSLREAVSGARSLEELCAIYPAYVAEVMRRIDPGAVRGFVDLLLAADAQGGTIYFAGNGGSAAQAAHFVNDLRLGTSRPGRPGLGAVSLVENAAVLTAAANDAGYESVFVRQLEGHLRPADLLVVLSASGNSENLLRAVVYAREVGAATAALLGFDGGKLASIVDQAVLVPTTNGEYGPVEDAFSLLDHLVTLYLSAERGRQGAPGRAAQVASP